MNLILLTWNFVCILLIYFKNYKNINDTKNNTQKLHKQIVIHSRVNYRNFISFFLRL